MKKQNRQRQQLLQRKRTKRNASRKGVKYNPNKFIERGIILQNDDVISL